MRSNPARTAPRFAIALAMLAVVLKVLIPAGYMFDTKAAAAGLTPITLCTAQGAIKVLQDQDGGIHKPEKGSHSVSPMADCVFAGHGAPIAPVFTNPDMAQAVTYVVITAAPPAAPARLGQGLVAPPPPSHAPPVFV